MLNDRQTPADALNIMFFHIVLFVSGGSGCIHVVHLSNEHNSPLVLWSQTMVSYLHGEARSSKKDTNTCFNEGVITKVQLI